MILTKDAPLGDAFFGVDNTFLTRALDAKVFDRYRPPALGTVAAERCASTRPATRPRSTSATSASTSTRSGSRDQQRARCRATLDDLTEAARTRTSSSSRTRPRRSTGLAFVAATVAKYGDGWLDYWDRLRANGVQVVDGWEQAYNGEFSGAAGSKGTRPLVVSYASSPPAEVYFADPQPTTAPTASLAGTCFRQVEFVGVLHGAAHPAAARKLVDFMLSADVPGRHPAPDVRVSRR